MSSSGLTKEIAELLGEAAVEIANLDGPDNVVCRRLRQMQRRIVPLSTTVGELARRIDVGPRDILDAAIAIGVRPFWHEGQQFRDAAYLEAYLRLQFHYDPVPEVEFNLTPEVAERLAEELSVTPDELLTDSDSLQTSHPAGDDASKKTPRKFVASQSKLPDQSNRAKRRDQIG